ncbi:MAG: site-specific integrase [Actinobacteria bacterium]|nr:site-specific integrase [Actinomycetota bacterium]MBU4392902.1 site-specific integrase [Actinomycetota bacterium]MCG2820050.1 site-specific integrase [Actinomycetes bacterium]
MSYITTKETEAGTRYYVVYNDRYGKRRWKVAGSTELEAQHLKLRIDAGLFPEERTPDRATTFSELCDLWLPRRAARNIRPRTADGYEQVIRCHLDPFFHDQLVSRITLEDCDEFVLWEGRRGTQPPTVNKSLTVLKMILKDALRWKYLHDDFLDDIKKITVNRPEMQFLNLQEIDRFLAAASPNYHALFATAIYSGARQGELIGLRRCNVDLKNAGIRICEAYYEKYGYDQPKSDAGKRIIKISPRLVSILKEHLERVDGGPEDLVFQNKEGRHINPQNMIVREFHPALERAGVKRIRFHDGRHTYGGLLASNSFPLKFIQRQMGHASIVTTLDLYGHLIPEVVERFGERFDALLSLGS